MKKIIKVRFFGILLVLSVIFSLVLPATSVAEPAEYVDTKYNFTELEDSMRLLGRAVIDGSTLQLSMTASGVEFKAYCKGDISFYILPSESGYLDVVVDEDYENMTRVAIDQGRRRYSAGLDLNPGLHKIRLVRASEFNHGMFTVNNITVCGEKYGAKPAEKGMKLEFYGDSITAGYGNITTQPYSWTWEYADGCLTYAAYCAYNLGADFSSVAASGYGINHGHSDDVSTVSTYWDITGTGAKWDFSYDADVVVINLGTNDYTYYNSNEQVWDKSVFKAGCMELINNIRSYNPDCHMIWVYGMNAIFDNSYSQIPSTIEELGAELDYLDVIKITTAQSGGDSHPNVAEHKKAGEQLSDFINKLYADNGWTMPADPADPDPAQPGATTAATEADTTTSTTVNTVTTTAEATSTASPTPTKIGDINGDGGVNIYDLLIMKKCIAVESYAAQYPSADLNGDSAVNIHDLLIMKKAVAII